MSIGTAHCLLAVALCPMVLGRGDNTTDPPISGVKYVIPFEN